VARAVEEREDCAGERLYNKAFAGGRCAYAVPEPTFPANGGERGRRICGVVCLARCESGNCGVGKLRYVEMVGASPFGESE
jgi:hypothetical protein